MMVESVVCAIPHVSFQQSLHLPNQVSFCFIVVNKVAVASICSCVIGKFVCLKHASELCGGHWTDCCLRLD